MQIAPLEFHLVVQPLETIIVVCFCESVCVLPGICYLVEKSVLGYMIFSGTSEKSCWTSRPRVWKETENQAK
jgi:hypothetical protein